MIDAFDDVQRAQQDRERHAQRGRILSQRHPAARPRRGPAYDPRGRSAYKERLVNEADGEAQRFISVYEAYRQNPAVDPPAACIWKPCRRCLGQLRQGAPRPLGRRRDGPLPAPERAASHTSFSRRPVREEPSHETIQDLLIIAGVVVAPRHSGYDHAVHRKPDGSRPLCCSSATRSCGSNKDPGLHWKLPWQSLEYYEQPSAQPRSAGRAHYPFGPEAAPGRFLRALHASPIPLRFFQTVRTERAAAAYGSAASSTATSCAACSATTISPACCRSERADIMRSDQGRRERVRASRFGIETGRRAHAARRPAEGNQRIRLRPYALRARTRGQAEFRAQGFEQAQRIKAGGRPGGHGDPSRGRARGGDPARPGRRRADDGSSTTPTARTPDFFNFYRSMQAYERSLVEGTYMVLSPDSEFFNFFSSTSDAGKGDPIHRTPAAAGERQRVTPYDPVCVDDRPVHGARPRPGYRGPGAWLCSPTASSGHACQVCTRGAARCAQRISGVSGSPVIGLFVVWLLRG